MRTLSRVARLEHHKQCIQASNELSDWDLAFARGRLASRWLQRKMLSIFPVDVRRLIRVVLPDISDAVSLS